MLAFWWRPLSFVALLALFSLFIGAILGRVSGLVVLSLGLGWGLFLHLHQLARLYAWLGKPGRSMPSAEGSWGEVFYRLNKLVRSHLDAEHRVSAELEQMQQATGSLPDGVVILDGHNSILWLNNAAQGMFGLKPERDIGQFVSYLVRNSRFNEWLVAEDFNQTLALTAPGAQEKTLVLRLVPLSRQPEMKMLIAHDITEITRLEAVRRDFVANVSHELRTPVTVIVGFLETFAEMDRPDPVQFKQHIALLREQSDRIRRLVDDLLTLARLEGDSEVSDEPVNVPSVVERLLGEARGLSHGQHQITAEVDGQAWLLGSEHEIYSAFTNLVSNAVRYTPPGGQIRLRWLEREDGGVEFAVTDSGEGIEPQHIPRLTERFYRVDRGRSRASGGTGLGLAIVKHIIQRHQGRLRIESTVGKGSTFAACFPHERLIPPPVALNADAEPQADAA